MLSWVPSIFKRFSGIKAPTRKGEPESTLMPAMLRLGSRTYPCTVVGQIGDKTLVNLPRDIRLESTDPIDIKLDRDRTYRRFSLRWKHGLQISVQPITTWAAPKTQA